MAMTLDDYVFTVPPETFTIPMSDKASATVKTYTSAAFFSWGLSIIGKIITLEWGMITQEVFDQLNTIYLQDEQVVWLPGFDDLSYNVDILGLEGKYVGYGYGDEQPWRRDVKMTMVIMGINA
jgi:hypothetical protein